jgi:hypothetical protein
LEEVLAPSVVGRAYRPASVRALAVLAWGVPVSALLLYASWYHHGYTWGSRFLLPVIPFMMLPLAYLRPPKTPLKRCALIAIVTLSLGVQVLGVLSHVGSYSKMAGPLLRAGVLDSTAALAHDDTWEDPLRTRLAVHGIVLLEAVREVWDQGELSTRYIDLWPITLSRYFGVPLSISLSIELALLAVVALTGRELARRQGRARAEVRSPSAGDTAL